MLPSVLNNYIGLPFKELGRTREGIDCWGLVRMILKEQFKIELPIFDNEYKNVKDAKNISRIVDNFLPNWQKVDQPSFGDVALFRVGKYPLHVGVAVSSTHMIHVERGVNSVISEMHGFVWGQRFLHAYRFIG